MGGAGGSELAEEQLRLLKKKEREEIEERRKKQEERDERDRSRRLRRSIGSDLTRGGLLGASVSLGSAGLSGSSTGVSSPTVLGA